MRRVLPYVRGVPSRRVHPPRGPPPRRVGAFQRRPMSRIRPYVRGARSRRLATAGVAATAATLLAAALSPAAGAADRPTRATALENAASVLADRASTLGLPSAPDTK